MKHSKIGASSLSRWAKCPGSVKLSEGIETTTSPYAEEGTKAHEYASHWLLNKEWPKGEIITEEMKGHIWTYIEAINADLKEVRKNDPKAELWVERSFDLGSLHPGLYGTADCVLYDEVESKLYVYDFKYGAGVPVEIINSDGDFNGQLAYYGLGALVDLKVPVEEIDLIIVQPRCPHDHGPIRRVTLDVMEIFDFSEDLIAWAKKTEDPNAPLIPGDQCRWCPAAGLCPAIREKSVALAKQVFNPVVQYDPERLSEVLNWLPAVEAWVRSVREFAYAEACHGRTPPGYKLVDKRAIRKWRSDVDVEMLADTIGLSEDMICEKKLLSPAQIEKKLTKDGKELIKSLVISEAHGQTLVSENDKRESKSIKPENVFSPVIH